MTTETTRIYRCQCGSLDGFERCCRTGPLDQMRLVEYMPMHLRASHEAAGNRGYYPQNGSIRVCVCADCLAIMEEQDTQGELETWLTYMGEADPDYAEEEEHTCECCEGCDSTDDLELEVATGVWLCSTCRDYSVDDEGVVHCACSEDDEEEGR